MISQYFVKMGFKLAICKGDRRLERGELKEKYYWNLWELSLLELWKGGFKEIFNLKFLLCLEWVLCLI